MRNQFLPFLRATLPLLLCLTLTSVALTHHRVPVLAQSSPPTPMPLPSNDELIVIAGGYGATLYAADGAIIAELDPGARLTADRKSSDSDWFHVTTADGASGWAERGALILFERIVLPTEEITITPAEASTLTVATTPAVTSTIMSTMTMTEAGEAGVVDTTAASETADTMAGTTGEHAGAALGDTVTAQVRTGTERLNVRSGPGTGYPVIGKAASGETLAVVGRNADQGWLYVARIDDVTAAPIGWVATQFLALSDPLTDVAVTDAVVMDAVAAPVAANAMATTAPVQRQTMPTGLQGKLVFNDKGGGTIYLYQLTTGQLTPLTTGQDPALSPDGTQVAFSRSGGESGIYLINVDGSNERKIFGERELLRSPKWSPDGRYIVFSRGDEYNDCYLDEDTGECLRFTPFFTEGLETGKDHIRKLARIDTNGENYRDLAVVEEAVTPDWNSAGVVYQSGAGLQITQDTSENQNRLLYFEIRLQYHQDPDWQPGNGRIVFQQRRGSHYDVYAIHPDGNGLTPLTRPATTFVDQQPSNVSPAWSPDGGSIVYLSNRTAAEDAGPWRLWVMNADGSNQRPLPIDVTFDYRYASEQMVDWGP